MEDRILRVRMFMVVSLWIITLGAPAQHTLRYTYQDRLIFLPVTVNDHDSLLFLLDTGANVSAIDTKTADRLELPELRRDTVEGTAGKIVVPNVHAHSVSIGDIEVKDIHFTTYDMSGMLAPPGHNLSGILGMDFMKELVVTLDFTDSLITFSRTRKDTTESSFPIEMDNGIPRTHIRIGGIEMPMRFDTGSSIFESGEIYLNVTERFKEELLRAQPELEPVAHLSASGIGGTVEMPVYQVKDIQIGEIPIKEARLIVQPEAGYFARPDAAGFCGNNLLEKFGKVIFDMPGGVVFIGNGRF